MRTFAGHRRVLSHGHAQGVERAIGRAMEGFGHEYHFGRHLVPLLRALGLSEIDMEGRVYIRQGPRVEAARLTVERLRGRMIQLGLASEADLEAYVSLVEQSNFLALGQTLIAAWGRRLVT